MNSRSSRVVPSSSCCPAGELKADLQQWRIGGPVQARDVDERRVVTGDGQRPGGDGEPRRPPHAVEAEAIVELASGDDGLCGSHPIPAASQMHRLEWPDNASVAPTTTSAATGIPATLG